MTKSRFYKKKTYVKNRSIQKISPKNTLTYYNDYSQTTFCLQEMGIVKKKIALYRETSLNGGDKAAILLLYHLELNVQFKNKELQQLPKWP